MDDSTYKVYICRSISSSKPGNECPVHEISGVKWDRISGGVHAPQKGYSLYGYIPYELGLKLLPESCSGQHNFGDNDMKIAIPASRNENSVYREGYKMLLEKAGPKPSSNRKSSLPPCTKRILEMAPISREELFKQLKSEGYTSYRISGAISQLIETNRIHLDAPRMSPKYTIHKV